MSLLFISFFLSIRNICAWFPLLRIVLQVIRSSIHVWFSLLGIRMHKILLVILSQHIFWGILRSLQFSICLPFALPKILLNQTVRVPMWIIHRIRYIHCHLIFFWSVRFLFCCTSARYKLLQFISYAPTTSRWSLDN